MKKLNNLADPLIAKEVIPYLAKNSKNFNVRSPAEQWIKSHLQTLCDHNWNGCMCKLCGVIRDEQHHLSNCRCTVCGKVLHHFVGCVCKICNEVVHDWEILSKGIIPTPGRPCLLVNAKQPIHPEFINKAKY